MTIFRFLKNSPELNTEPVLVPELTPPGSRSGSATLAPATMVEICWNNTSTGTYYTNSFEYGLVALIFRRMGYWFSCTGVHYDLI